MTPFSRISIRHHVTQSIHVSRDLILVPQSYELTIDSTGVTGYIGGDTLYALYQKHSDYEISALIRTQDKADIVTKAYPKIRTVLGGLDDYDLIKEEASKADVVIRTPQPGLHDTLADSKQTPPTRPITKALPKQLQLDSRPDTRKSDLDTGFTLAVQAS